MLRYYYVEQYDRLYVYDYDSGFYKIFNRTDNKWETPVVSFSQTERDFDIDFIEIPEADAKELSNGVSFDEQYKAFLALIGGV